MGLNEKYLGHWGYGFEGDYGAFLFSSGLSLCGCEVKPLAVLTLALLSDAAAAYLVALCSFSRWLIWTCLPSG